ARVVPGPGHLAGDELIRPRPARGGGGCAKERGDRRRIGEPGDVGGVGPAARRVPAQAQHRPARCDAGGTDRVRAHGGYRCWDVKTGTPTLPSAMVTTALPRLPAKESVDVETWSSSVSPARIL